VPSAFIRPPLEDAHPCRGLAGWGAATMAPCAAGWDSGSRALRLSGRATAVPDSLVAFPEADAMEVS